MRRYLLTVLPLFFLLPATAQFFRMNRASHDSLVRILPGLKGENRARTALELAEPIWDTVPGRAMGYIISAIEIADKLNNTGLKANTRMVRGSWFVSRRDFIHAQEDFLIALKLFRNCKDTIGEIEVLNRLGALSQMLADNKRALDFFTQGRSLAHLIGNSAREGQFIECVAIIKQQSGNFSEADRLFKQSKALYRSVGDRINEMHLDNSIGSILLDKHQYDTALKYYLGILQQCDTSQKCHLSTLYTRIGHIYFQTKDYRTSLKYNRLAYKIRQQYCTPVDINSSLINIGGDYYMLGIPDSGRIYFDKGLKLALQYDRKFLVQNAYRHLYVYHRNRGDYKTAFDFYMKYISVDSTIKQERYRSNISVLEANQKMQQMREDGKVLESKLSIQKLNQENQQYQYTFVKVLTGATAILVFGFILQMLYIRRVRWDMQGLNVRLSKEIKEKEKTEHQASEREQQFRFLSEHSEDFISHLDSNLKRIYASPACKRIFGYEQDEILKLTPIDLIHPDYIGYWEVKFNEMKDKRFAQPFIYLAKRKDGSAFWVEALFNPLFDRTGGIFKGMVGVTRDITERKKIEFEIMDGTKQKENLLKEIHHRVKNNFAILVSLINMQMAQTKNSELLQSLTNLQLRIRTMALVHEMLYRSKDFENISFPDYLRSLASVIAGTFNRREISMNFEADESVMDIEASIPLGLIVNEILSNSYKHAFPDSREGQIWISFKVNRQTGDHTLVIQDDGIGLPSGQELENCKSMGLQVVQILCQQIEGTLEMINDHGLGFTITFKPLPRAS